MDDSKIFSKILTELSKHRPKFFLKKGCYSLRPTCLLFDKNKFLLSKLQQRPEASLDRQVEKALAFLAVPRLDYRSTRILL